MINKWCNYSLTEYLKDKQERSVHPNEYMLLIDFIKEIRPDTIIDVGTYLGTSSYILASCCPSIKYSYTIENIDSPEYYHKPDATKEEHGKYIDKEFTTFLTNGYEGGIFEGLIDKHPNVIVFWDAGKNPFKVIRQIELSYKSYVKYIAIHDTGLKKVRRAINRAVSLRWYKIIKEDVKSCPEKGISILKRI